MKVYTYSEARQQLVEGHSQRVQVGPAVDGGRLGQLPGGH